ncbi:MAG TPA: hypothetical protein VGN54_12755 [Mycobacteriales bacterium]|jgi:hypothetical protein|nr:hypothetical protein [Mycobacteriales bacterium]
MRDSNEEVPQGPDRRRGRGPGQDRGQGRGRGPGGHGHGRGGHGFGRPGGWQHADLPGVDDAAAWLGGRLPADWFVGAPVVTVDRDEIVISGELAAPDRPADADESTMQSAVLGRITRFREETRDQRIQIAREAEARYGRRIAWGASIGEQQILFTHLAAPVMTRLRQDERRVLDTLVDAGVARSRSDALSWCVKLVGQHAGDWLADLRTAMSDVDKLRTEGPDV